MLQSLKKALKADPDILASISLGHNWTRIAYLVRKWNFWGISLIIFIDLLCPIMLQSLKKNP